MFSVEDAINALDGHAVLTVEGAKEICQTLGVPFDETLIFSWETSRQALDDYGFFPYTEGKGSGVDALRLSYTIVQQLGIQPAPGNAFSGKGFQARANREAIREKLTWENNTSS